MKEDKGIFEQCCNSGGTYSTFFMVLLILTWDLVGRWKGSLESNKLKKISRKLVLCNVGKASMNIRGKTNTKKEKSVN